MGEVSEFKRRVFSGVEADMVAVPSPAVGDKYIATDSGKSFFYTGSEWIRGLLEGMIDHTWEGDDADNREIDLGDDYDFILIFIEESKAQADDHASMAHAFKSCYGLFHHAGAFSGTRHLAMASTNVLFQGKMTGGDVTKIKLGSTGNNAAGVNVLNQTYRLIGFKFQDMV